MRQCFDLFPGVLAPVLSLDQLYANRAEGSTRFDLTDPKLTPHQALELSQAIAAINSFVASLPQRDQHIVRSVFWECKSQTDVAVEFKVSKMAISKAMARVYERGRAALSGHEHLAFSF